MRALGLPLIAVALVGVGIVAACEDPTTKFGPPNGIVDQEVPGAGETPPPTTSASSGTAPAGNDPPAPAEPLKDLHAGAGGPATTATRTLACLSCHSAGGSPPVLTFGGKSDRPGAVVTVTGSPAVKADNEGYFWLAGAAIADGSKVSVSGAARPMASPLTSPAGGSCDSAGGCHGGTAPTY